MSEEKTNLDIRILKKFARLEKKRDALKNALNKTEAELSPLNEFVTDHLIDCGISNISIDGRNLFIRHDIYAKLLTNKDDATKALKKAGLKEYIDEGFNTNSLSAYVREKIKSKEDLPEAFDGIIGASHVYRARSNKKS